MERWTSRRGGILRSTGGVAFAAWLLLFSGCLSLGGRTTYVQESTETPHRLNALEARVTAAESRLNLIEHTIAPPPMQGPPFQNSSLQGPTLPSPSDRPYDNGSLPSP